MEDRFLIYYYVDGYNLIFSMIESKHSLASQRQTIIRFLQKQFAIHHLSGMIVFDGAHRRDEESGRSYRSPLEIAYAPKGQSADAYIVEQVERAKNPKQVIVVTNDKGLTMHARSSGAKAQTNGEFLQFLGKKSAKGKRGEKIVISETPYNLERLLKIFEERLKDDREEE